MFDLFCLLVLCQVLPEMDSFHDRSIRTSATLFLVFCCMYASVSCTDNNKTSDRISNNNETILASNQSLDTVDWYVIVLIALLFVTLIVALVVAYVWCVKLKKTMTKVIRRNKKRITMERDVEANQVEYQPTENDRKAMMELIKRWKPHPVEWNFKKEQSITLENYSPKKLDNSVRSKSLLSPTASSVSFKRSAKTSVSRKATSTSVCSSSKRPKTSSPSPDDQAISKSATSKCSMVPTVRSTIEKSKNKNKNKMSAKTSPSPVTSSKAPSPSRSSPKRSKASSSCGKVTSQLSAIKNKLVRTVRSAFNWPNSKSKKSGSKKPKNKKRNSKKKKKKK